MNSQIISWAKFIEVSYSMCNLGVSNPQQPKNFPVGWKLVKNINAEATAGPANKLEFIGFIAQSMGEPERFAVVLRGSEGFFDFLDDFEFIKIDFPFFPNAGKTENGFTQFYKSFTFADPASGKSQTLEEFLNDPLLQKSKFLVTGHSSGGALAILHSLTMANHGFAIETYTFGSPMVGDSSFAQTYNSLVPNSYRVANKPDIIPLLPGNLLEYEHVGTLIEMNSLVYPELKRSISNFHSLETYIYCLGKEK